MVVEPEPEVKFEKEVKVERGAQTRQAVEVVPVQQQPPPLLQVCSMFRLPDTFHDTLIFIFYLADLTKLVMTWKLKVFIFFFNQFGPKFRAVSILLHSWLS